MTGEREAAMVTLEEIGTDRGRALVWAGGDGQPLVLLHGGWGGAAMHWAPVWDLLADRFQVVAPELPGIGDLGSPGLSSFDAYAEWVSGLLDTLGVRHAWIAGNSFGASVAWQLAGRLGARCRGLVLVDGMPVPETPPVLRVLAAIPPIRWLFRALYRRVVFSPSALPRAFFDPGLAPQELVWLLAHPPPAQVELLFRVIVAGGGGPAPIAPTLVVWGKADRLPGTSIETARKVQLGIPGARLLSIPEAGHCPQLEKPREFAAAIGEFAGATGPERS